MLEHLAGHLHPQTDLRALAKAYSPRAWRAEAYQIEGSPMSAPIIPWIGGKRRLADRLIPLFPPHECYVELFCGGAARSLRPPSHQRRLF